MNILYISPSDPALMRNGGEQRSAFLHQALSKIGTVYTIVPEMFSKRASDDPVRRVRHLCVEKRYFPKWVVKHLFKRLFPFVVLPFYAAKAKGQLFPEVIFDCVVVRYTEWVAYYAAWRVAPVYVDIDDDPVEVYETVYRKRSLFFKRAFNKLLIQKWCDWVYSRCAGGWVANSDQVISIKNIRLRHLPNIAVAPKPAYCAHGKQEELLLTIGCMAYEPNYKGVDHFLKTYWPEIKKAFPNMRYFIVGTGCPLFMIRRWRRYDGVEVLGFVEELSRLYERCLMTVAPVYAGGGTCIKVIESLLYGRHCLVSDFAVRGWEAPQVTPANGLVRLGEPGRLADVLRPLLEGIRANPCYGRPFADFAAAHFGPEVFQAAVEGVLRGQF